MKTPFFITLALCVCFISNIKAQSDTSQELFKNYDPIILQLDKQNLPFIGSSGTGECPSPSNTLMLGKKTDGGLPYIPPESDGRGTYVPPIEDDVNIYWIHGLNGSVESLRVPAMTTEFGTMDRTFVARKAHSVIGLTGGDQTYLENNGIAYAARDMRDVADKLPAAYVHTNKDFIIAHSQGGIVAREWLRDIEEYPAQFKKYAHGLVTFGTPHGGARILNKTRPDLENKAPEFFKEACEKLGLSAIQMQIKDKFFLQMVLSKEMKDRFVNTACSFFAETVVPFALDNYHKPTTIDYYIGSPFLNKPSNLHPTGLSYYELKVPLVQFYGEEEQPIMWRFFSSTMELGKDQVLQSGNAGGEYAYDKDDQLQAKVSTLMNDFQAEYNDAAEKYKKLKVVRTVSLAFGVPALAILMQFDANKSKQSMDAYDGAKVWLANANDYYLTDIVGARVSSTVKYCVVKTSESCTDASVTPPRVTHTTTSVETPAGNNNCVTGILSITHRYPTNYIDCQVIKQSLTVYRNEYYYKANDGIVLAESAASAIKVNSGETHKYQKMPRTNHDQMKNSYRTKEALTELYDGNLGAFFKIDPR